MHLNWHNQYADVINSKLDKPQEFIKILKKQVKTTVSIAWVDFREGLKCLIWHIPYNVTWPKRHLFTSSFCYNPCLISRRVVICLHRFIILLLRYKGKNKSIPHYSARVRRTTFWKGMGNTMRSYNTAHSNINQIIAVPHRITPVWRKYLK